MDGTSELELELCVSHKNHGLDLQAEVLGHPRRHLGGGGPTGGWAGGHKDVACTGDGLVKGLDVPLQVIHFLLQLSCRTAYTCRWIEIYNKHACTNVY